MSKPNHNPVRKDATNKAVTPAKPQASAPIIDAGIVLKAINTMVSLKRERDYLRAECDRKDMAIRQLENIINEKDRAFNTCLIERDAWHKTAEQVEHCRHVAEINYKVYEGRSLFWRAMFIATALISVAAVVIKLYVARW